MNKTIILIALVLCASAANGNSKTKPMKHAPVTFQSAFFEIMNVGEKDYQLDLQEAENWDKVRINHEEPHKPKPKSFAQVQTTITDVVDLSNNVGVIELQVTGIDGNVIPQYATDSPLIVDEQPVQHDVATEKLKADRERIQQEDAVANNQEFHLI